MDVTDVQRLGGTPVSMVGACSGPSGAPPMVPVAPDCCPRTVPPSTRRGVVPWPERVLLLNSFTTVVHIGNSRSASIVEDFGGISRGVEFDSRIGHHVENCVLRAGYAAVLW